MTFYELEKLCKQRRMKKRVFFIIFIFLILFIIYFIWNLYEISSKKPLILQKTKQKIVKKDINNSLIIKKNIKSETNKSNLHTKEVVLTPVISLDINDINISNGTQNISKKTVLKKETLIKASKQVIDKSNKVNIITTEILPSYDECIYQAEDALKNKDYSLALKWAQNANIKNKIRPEAWILSAKILYLEGKKQKALDILKLYLKYHKNKKIENFLRKLENEK